MVVSIKKITSEQSWPIRHKVMYPNMQIEHIMLPKDELAEHFGLFENGELLSVVSLFIAGDSAQFRKLATVEEKQRQGHGSALLLYIIEYSIRLNVSRLWCNARKNKLEFYKKVGFIETEVLFSKDGFDFVIMEKELKRD